MTEQATAEAIAALRRLRARLDAGADLGEAFAGAAAGLPREAREGLAGALRRASGDYDEDEWGFDRQAADLVRPFFDFMYERWWRVEIDGIANVPADGRALLVANHAGIVPWDATMIATAILREHPRPRHPRFLVLDWAFQLPYAGMLIRKVGGVVASPYNAMRLLEDDQLVAVFPEGVKGAGKDWSERYRLQRFGRGGFVEVALRTGAPIVPVAVVGSEEIYPKIGEAPLLARAAGMPYFPITPTFPWLGPLGAVPLPSKWRLEFCDPIDVSEHGPDAAEDPMLLFDLTERVRDTVQDAVFRQLVKRGPAFM